MKIKQLSLGPLGTNGYILSTNSQALIIDPGGEAEKIISYIKEEGLQPKAILLTHAHFDHIGALEEVRSHYNIDVYVHELESDWLLNPDLNGSSQFMLDNVVAKSADKFFTTRKTFIGMFEFEVIHTPGHSPGSVTFIFQSEQFVISGDVLFQNGIGRTDLPGGDIKILEGSIKNKLYKLSSEYSVYCGHGKSTTIGHEQQYNPFFRA